MGVWMVDGRRYSISDDYADHKDVDEVMGLVAVDRPLLLEHCDDGLMSDAAFELTVLAPEDRRTVKGPDGGGWRVQSRLKGRVRLVETTRDRGVSTYVADPLEPDELVFEQKCWVAVSDRSDKYVDWARTVTARSQVLALLKQAEFKLAAMQQRVREESKVPRWKYWASYAALCVAIFAPIPALAWVLVLLRPHGRDAVIVLGAVLEAALFLRMYGRRDSRRLLVRSVIFVQLFVGLGLWAVIGNAHGHKQFYSDCVQLIPLLMLTLFFQARAFDLRHRIWNYEALLRVLFTLALMVVALAQALLADFTNQPMGAGIIVGAIGASLAGIVLYALIGSSEELVN